MRRTYFHDQLAKLATVLAAFSVLVAADSVWAQTPEPRTTRAPMVFTVFPFAGMSANKRDDRLPLSPMVGVRVSVDLWSQVTPTRRIGTFVGLTGSVLTVSEQRVCRPNSCQGATDFLVDYLATADVGLKVDGPGQPYALVFLGRAYPSVSRDFDPVTQRYGQTLSMTWGAGGGASLSVGGMSIQIEGRFRKDTRFGSDVENAWEFLVGLPLGTR